MFEKCYESRTINEEIFMIYLMTSQLRQYICIVHENEKKYGMLVVFNRHSHCGNIVSSKETKQ